MANIWPVYEGKEPTIGGPWAQLPVLEAVDLFELQPKDHVSDLSSTPRFGDVQRDLSPMGFKHIVVEVGRNEGRRAKWKPGFYKSRVTPRDAFLRLLRQAIAAELGDDNVVRLETEPTTDSQGREALKIIVVIPPDATQRLKDQSVLDGLVRVQERLREMRETRIPTIEYATEAELEQDAGPQS